MLRIALCLGLGLNLLGTAMAADAQPSPVAGPAPIAGPSVPGTDREDRGSKTFGLLNGASLKPLVPGLFSIISFNNEPCTGESGKMGICYSQKECKEMEATADGTCAKGYGVCCMTGGGCGDTISTSGSSFTGSTSSAGICTSILAPPEGTCQIKLDFTSLNLLGPVEGDCGNDTFVVVGANSGTEIPVICGDNDGQHMYIDIDNSDGPYQLIVTTSGETVARDWDVMVTYLGEGDASCAPNRCLQYYTETSGTIESFGFPLMSNNQKYSICFGYVSGYCDIAFAADRFDLGGLTTCTNDFVAVSGEKFCGDFIDMQFQANATGPIVISVMTDDNGEREEEGFSGTYTMLGC